VRRSATTEQKLIITVTVDSTGSYPGYCHMPDIEDLPSVAEQYVNAVEAGASIVHHHGISRLEDKLQPDGKRLARVDFAGWKSLTEQIRDRCDAIIQFGIAGARIEEKIALLELKPDMMSYAFNPHDEYFQPDPSFEPIEEYSLHTRDELEEFCSAAVKAGVKVETECFYTGAYFNLEFIRDRGLLPDPVWASLFLGWGGAGWTPPTFDSLLYLTNHLPANVNWNLSVMDTAMQWRLHALAIGMGGHVRVGWEDNPYLPDGTATKQNAELVSAVADLALSLGRQVATPDEARKIIGLK
jgi:3-keto-5-aminohexanoate cleavage enzyme